MTRFAPVAVALGLLAAGAAPVHARAVRPGVGFPQFAGEVNLGLYTLGALGATERRQRGANSFLFGEVAAGLHLSPQLSIQGLAHVEPVGETDERRLAARPTQTLGQPVAHRQLHRGFGRTGAVLGGQRRRRLPVCALPARRRRRAGPVQQPARGVAPPGQFLTALDRCTIARDRTPGGGVSSAGGRAATIEGAFGLRSPIAGPRGGVLHPCRRPLSLARPPWASSSPAFRGDPVAGVCGAPDPVRRSVSDGTSSAGTRQLAESCALGPPCCSLRSPGVWSRSRETPRPTTL